MVSTPSSPNAMPDRRQFLQTVAGGGFAAAASALAASARTGYPPLGQIRRAFDSLPVHIRRAAQQRLYRGGFYDGAIDGLWGAGTRSAFEMVLETQAFARLPLDPDSLEAAMEAIGFVFTDFFASAYQRGRQYEQGDYCPSCEFGERLDDF